MSRNNEQQSNNTNHTTTTSTTANTTVTMNNAEQRLHLESVVEASKEFSLTADELSQRQDSDSKLLPTAKLYKNTGNNASGVVDGVDGVGLQVTTTTTTTSSYRFVINKIRYLCKQHKQMIYDQPQNIGLSLFLFIILLASGIALTITFENSIKQKQQSEALVLAKDTAMFFSSNLDDAILPLFSLAQFVNEIDIFSNLASKIGLPNQPGSLPFLPPKVDGGHITHRNISGVCDDPTTVSRFEKIAGDIKKNANMDGILVNLQLVPDAVVCLLHPINNTEDFPEGIYMDNSGALGHDLLTDPVRKFIAEVTVPSDDVVIAGPLTLRQCQDCDPTVEKAFIARLPIDSTTNKIVVNDQVYNKWGFAVALINWNELVDRSGVYEMFNENDLEFQLTRTDQKYNPNDDTHTEKVVVLAESPQFQTSVGEQVSTILPTTNNDWEITIMYCTEGCNTWYPWVIAAVTIISFFLALLVYIILSQNQLHNNILSEKQAQMVSSSRKAAQSERELNDFIAHEVRNPLSAAMSATSFVSTTVNEREPLIDDESKESVRSDVRIIEASLQFINDLLRSMLDLHRARSNQLTLEEVPTDIKRDVLEPVASMLYHRDSMFTVDVDCCPDNLIVSVDRLRLKQIVLNLARNSSKFVEKGFVRIRACVAPEPLEGIMIYVEDSGPGIPVEKRTKLFARFQDSLDELSQGTGIGLSLCKKLVDLMNGSIVLDESYHSGLESRPGAKLDIHIKCDIIDITEEDELPDTETNSSPDDDDDDIELGGLTPPPEATSLDIVSEEITVLPDKMNVLFVDDDMIIRKLFCRSLKRIRPEWDIQEAASGEAAIKAVGESTTDFDLIFCDQYMTSVDKQLLGTETVRKLRAEGVECFICGLSANDMEEPFKGAGADAFMLKPFPCKPEPLTQEMLRILNKKEFVY